MRRVATVVLVLAIIGVLFVILIHPYVDGPNSTAVTHRIHQPAILVSILPWNQTLSSISVISAAFFNNHETPDRLALNCVLLC